MKVTKVTSSSLYTFDYFQAKGTEPAVCMNLQITVKDSVTFVSGNSFQKVQKSIRASTFTIIYVGFAIDEKHFMT